MSIQEHIDTFHLIDTDESIHGVYSPACLLTYVIGTSLVYRYRWVYIDYVYSPACLLTYGVATISRLLQIIGLFCKRAL